MIPIKEKHSQVNLRTRFFKKKFLLFGFLVIGSFLAGFVLFRILYGFGLLSKLYNMLF
jgi:hypothetical protein